jgi:hypothetical protein
MNLHRTFSGLEATLHPRGPGRFVGAAFLLVWLAGWLIGEAFALWILGVGAWALVTGQPPGPGRDPLALAPSLAAGVFLLGWLALWTFGGFAAIAEFLRLIWSSDRVVAREDGIELIRRVGPFTRTIRLAREDLRGFHHRADGSALVAETRSGAVELTRFGSSQDKASLAQALATELKLAGRPPLPPALPDTWREVPSLEGDRVLVNNPGTRRIQALVAWLVAAPICGVAALIARAAASDRTIVPLAVMAVAAAVALTWGAAWLSLTRMEWKLESGRITQQRRLGSRVRPRFEGTAVVLDATNDGDGDTWYALHLVAPTAANATPREKHRAQRTLVKALHDPTAPRRLGEWIAARTGTPFNDLTGELAKPVDLKALAAQLESSGRFGRWAGRILRRWQGRGRI